MTREPGETTPGTPSRRGGSSERSGPLGPLGRRLFVAFLFVALSSVITLTVAALIGTGLGLSSARQADRELVAGRAARSVALAYAGAGGWSGADLRPARAVADGAGAMLIVLAEDGTLVTGTEPGAGRGMNPTPGPMRHGMGEGSGRVATADVVVGGRTVGSVRLRFETPADSGPRRVAWVWIAVAAVVALGVALAMSWYITRWLSAPLLGVTRTARAIAAGDRTARTGVTAPGEIGELARAFDGMADEVQRVERVRRHLAADVAHELRTPLSALQAGLEELRDGLAEPDLARLAALHDQALRLGRIVGDLAELAAAESAALSLRPAPVDLGELAAAVLADRDPELRAAGVKVHADLPSGVVVNGDSGRLHQALGNILANTARYCRPGDSVTVEVRAEREAAVVDIADTGPGIPSADLPHVFDRLWRGQGSGRVSGSGIGLAVVRELITAHGGTVSVESDGTAGTRFTIRLPALAPVRSASSAPSALSAPPG